MRGGPLDRGGQRERLLDHASRWRAVAARCRSIRADHLVVQRLGRRDERHRPTAVRRRARRRCATSRSRRRRAAASCAISSRSLRAPRSPSSNACFMLALSLTVSASSTSSAGASRPVSTTETAFGALPQRGHHVLERDPAPGDRVGDLVQHDEVVARPPRSTAAACAHASRAMSAARSRSSLSQVKPSPITDQSDPEPLARDPLAGAPPPRLHELHDGDAPAVARRRASRCPSPRSSCPCRRRCARTTSEATRRSARCGASTGGCSLTARAATRGRHDDQLAVRSAHHVHRHAVVPLQHVGAQDRLGRVRRPRAARRRAARSDRSSGRQASGRASPTPR